MRRLREVAVSIHPQGLLLDAPHSIADCRAAIGSEGAEALVESLVHSEVLP
jgi:hypothetical protein